MSGVPQKGAPGVELVLHDVALVSMRIKPPPFALPSAPSMPSRPELIVLLVALLAMYGPTYQLLDQEVWSVVGQGHGPVMAALTLWLVWQRLPLLREMSQCATLLSRLIGAASLALGLAMYVVGRSQHHLGLHTGSQFFVFTALLLLYGGWPALRAMWFPLLFSLTLVPLPGSIVGALTGPLKAAVSYVAEAILYHTGYPVGRSGVTLTIGAYKLLVADACAGLNSVFALEAIGIFYMSIAQHSSRLRNLLLALLILPISFISNVLRVISLVLITYYFGDDVGQGFAHNFAGVFLFVIATVLMISTDTLIGKCMSSSANKAGQK